MGDGGFGSTHGGNPNPKFKLKLKLALLVSAILAVASVLSVGIVLGTRTRGSTRPESRTAQRHAPNPSLAISRTCNRTRYPTLCVDSLVNFPGALAAGELDLVQISVNATLQRFGRALSLVSSEIDAAEKTDPWVRAAYEDCVEMLEDSVEELSRSLAAVGRKPGGLPDDDVVTWLSGAMTNQETCREGLKQGKVKKERLEGRMRDLSKLVSNCLAIYKAAAAAAGGEGGGRRRLMMRNMPEWVGRELVEAPTSAIKADIVVSKEGGNGRLKTIREAINSVPDHRNRRTIIYVMAGR